MLDRIPNLWRSVTVWVALIVIGGAFSIAHGLTGGSRKWIGMVLVLALFLFLRKWEEWVSVSMLLGVLVLAGSRLPLQDLALEYRWHFYLLIVLTGLVRGFHDGFRNLNLGLNHLVIALLVILALLSSWWAIYPPTSFLRAVSLGLAGVCLWGTVWQYMTTPARIERIMKLVALLVAGTFFLSFLAIPLLGGAFSAGRFVGILKNANYLGMLACVGLPAILWFSLRKGSPAWERWIWRGSFLLVLVGLGGAASRGTMLALLLGIPLYFLITRPRRTLLAGALLLIVVGFLFAYHVELVDNPLTKHLLRPENIATGANRTWLWQTAYLIYQHRPALGHGWGNSDQLIYEYDETEILIRVSVLYFHNSLLDVLLDLGLVGTCLWLLLVGIPIVAGFLALLRCRDPDLKNLLAYLWTGWIALLVNYQFQSGLLSFGSAWAFPTWLHGIALTRAAWIWRHRGGVPVPVQVTEPTLTAGQLAPAFR